jgi:hypothetical protein
MGLTELTCKCRGTGGFSVPCNGNTMYAQQLRAKSAARQQSVGWSCGHVACTRLPNAVLGAIVDKQSNSCCQHNVACGLVDNRQAGFAAYVCNQLNPPADGLGCAARVPEVLSNNQSRHMCNQELLPLSRPTRAAQKYNIAAAAAALLLPSCALCTTCTRTVLLACTAATKVDAAARCDASCAAYPVWPQGRIG